jgi:hypothetical protein
MRIERTNSHSSHPEFRLFQGDAEIGHIRDGAVGFQGFGSQADAAEAARIAAHALEQRRARATWMADAPEEFLVWERDDGMYVVARSGLLARLTLPDSAAESLGWGFEVRLLPEERVNLFAMARARTMWHALRWSGLCRRMRQLDLTPATAAEADALETAG